MNTLISYKVWFVSVYVALVYGQSAWQKLMANDYVMSLFAHKLDPWAAVIGFAGAFSGDGMFNAQTIGKIEAAVSVILVLSIVYRSAGWLALCGASLALVLSIGKLFFHLLTPLGVVIDYGAAGTDHGIQFMLACSTLVGSFWLLWRQLTTLETQGNPVFST